MQDLKRRPQQDVCVRAQEIWQEFLAEGAPSSINLDSHSYERTSHNIKDPGRYSFEDAQVPLKHTETSTHKHMHLHTQTHTHLTTLTHIHKHVLH